MSASILLLAILLSSTPSQADATSVPVFDERAEWSVAAKAMPDAPSTAETPAIVEASAADADAQTITVTAGRHNAPGDPLQGVNEASFAAIQLVDRAVVAPAARIYERVVPKPARNGLRNVFRNLREPMTFVNYVLQLKPGRAMASLGRFAVNSTVGGAGLVDMARRRPFNLPYRPNGFANTLAYYGVKPGAFLFLPIVGPTTVRDLVGRLVDTSFLPLPFANPLGGGAYAVSANALNTLERRNQREEELGDLRNNPHAYASYREFYLAKREREIAALHSRPPARERGPIQLSGTVTPQERTEIALNPAD